MSKMWLALGIILAVAACGGGQDEGELDNEMEMETAPATPAPAPMDTTMADTVMMDTGAAAMDTMGM